MTADAGTSVVRAATPRTSSCACECLCCDCCDEVEKLRRQLEAAYAAGEAGVLSEIEARGETLIERHRARSMRRVALVSVAITLVALVCLVVLALRLAGGAA